MNENDREFLELLAKMAEEVEAYDNYIPEEEIKVLMCEIDKEPYVTTIKNDLKTFQEIVGGGMEVAGIGEGIISVQHELGKFEKEPNRPVGGDYYFGNFFFCGLKLSNECSLTDSQIKEIKEWLENTIVCPFCLEKYEDRPALSRLIDGLLICPECGCKEALLPLGGSISMPKTMNDVIRCRERK